MTTKNFFILHIPSPVHGATMMGKYILDNQVINQASDYRYFKLTLPNSFRTRYHYFQ